MADQKRNDDMDGAREAVRKLLAWMGDDPDRPGLAAGNHVIKTGPGRSHTQGACSA